MQQTPQLPGRLRANASASAFSTISREESSLREQQCLFTAFHRGSRFPLRESVYALSVTQEPWLFLM